MVYLGRIGVALLICSFSLPLHAAESVEKKVKILGKTASVTQVVSGVEDPVEDRIAESGVESTTKVSVFGKKIEIAKSSVRYRVSEDEGISFDSNFYINGRKILAHGFVNGDGSFSYEADVPAADISGDIFSYSLGIVSLGVHTGVSYEGLLKAHLSSELLKKEPVWTTEMNIVDAAAEVDVVAKGFIEGQVKILFIKGGVGGALNLIDGAASASIQVDPTTVYSPVVAYAGVVNLLSGNFYAYIGSGKKKWVNWDIYKYKGYCYSFGESSCQSE